MKCFHSSGGNNKPYFAHRIKLSKMVSEAYDWCLEYNDEDRPFRRFHVEWDHYRAGQQGHKGYEIVQFEWEEAAIMFTLRWL